MEIIRKQQALTFEIEKKLLDRMAARMHKYVTADQLSAFGLCGAVVSACGYWLAGTNLAFLFLASFGIFMHWFGDSLDGRTARLRNENRPKYGHYLDHLLDGISFCIMALSVTFAGYTHTSIWVVVTLIYLLLMIHTLLKANVTGVFELAFARLGPTEARILMIGANTLVFVTGNATFVNSPFRINVFDACGIVSLLCMSYVYAKSVALTLWGERRIREGDN